MHILYTPSHMRKQCVTDTQSARRPKQFCLLREKDPIINSNKKIFTLENTVLRTVFKQKKLNHVRNCFKFIKVLHYTINVRDLNQFYFVRRIQPLDSNSFF